MNAQLIFQMLTLLQKYDSALIQIAAWRQAIIWTNDSLVHWSLYTSSGVNELNLFHRVAYPYFQAKQLGLLNGGIVRPHFLWPLLLTWFNFNPSMDK